MTMELWWEASKEAVHGRIEKTIKHIDTQQSRLRTRYAKFLSLYESKTIETLDGLAWADAADVIDEEEYKENLIRSAIDAITAKIGTNRPRARFLTRGGAYEMQKRAYRRTLFIDGVFHDTKLYAKSREVFADGGKFGTGLIKASADVLNGCIRNERVIVDEILVDYMDGKYRKPRSMFQIKTVSRDLVKKQWPKTSDLVIKNAGHVRPNMQVHQSIDDPVTVIEGWHLPSTPGNKDGRHIMGLTSGLLRDPKGKAMDRPWLRERFPFAEWRWKLNTFGWHAMGIGEDILPQQRELDYMNKKIQKLIWLMTIRLAIEKGSGIDEEEMDNSEYPSFYYVGKPPVEIRSMPIPDSMWAERERIIDSAFNQLGMSRLTAQSQLPRGLTAAVAQREYKDTESERFQDVAQNWDSFHMDIAEINLDVAEEMAEMDDVKGLEVNVPTGSNTQVVKWSEFKQDKRSDYQIEPWPAALLPIEPHGRVERINELIGMFPQAAPLLARAINHPDVEAAMSLVTASVDAILLDVDLLNEGKYRPPEPFLDLAVAKVVVLSSYQRAVSQNAPDKITTAHREYLLSLHNLMKEQQLEQMKMQAQAQMQAAGGMPGAMPGEQPPPDAGGGMPV